MWNLYLEREDSKVVGKSGAPMAPGDGSTLILSSCLRSVCGTVEKQRDLHLLRLHFHRLRPVLGFVHPAGSGEFHPGTGVVFRATAKASDFLSDLPSSQKTSGEVTLDDCLRLFTKEDMLDGEERPVRSLERHIGPVGSGHVIDRRFCLFRCAAGVKAEGNAPNA